jgi:hypothetical protein
VIGSLRFAGILIISVWLGAAVFFLVGVSPGVESGEMERLLGAKNYGYYSGAVAQMLSARLYYMELACGALALLHVLAGWLYLGKAPRRPWLGLLALLVMLTLLQAEWMQPRLRRLHLSAHAVNLAAPAREKAVDTLHAWNKIDFVVELFLIAGLTGYLWRVANPSDPPRFVSSVKFRG